MQRRQKPPRKTAAGPWSRSLAVALTLVLALVLAAGG